jgi:hypothetical protein
VKHSLREFSFVAPCSLCKDDTAHALNSKFDKLLLGVTDEQRMDQGFLKRFLRSPVVDEHIAELKQELEDARSNLIV